MNNYVTNFYQIDNCLKKCVTSSYVEFFWLSFPLNGIPFPIDQAPATNIGSYIKGDISYAELLAIEPEIEIPEEIRGLIEDREWMKSLDISATCKEAL